MKKAKSVEVTSLNLCDTIGGTPCSADISIRESGKNTLDTIHAAILQHVDYSYDVNAEIVCSIFVLVKVDWNIGRQEVCQQDYALHISFGEFFKIHLVVKVMVYVFYAKSIGVLFETVITSNYKDFAFLLKSSVTVFTPIKLVAPITYYLQCLNECGFFSLTQYPFIYHLCLFCNGFR